MRIIILSKAPVVGSVKTRLQPEYSAKNAAQIHKAMTQAVMQKTSEICDDIWLAVDDTRHVFFAELQSRFKFKLCYQGTGNLGVRLDRLMRQSFLSDDKALMFLGSDSPHVAKERYLEAFKNIEYSDVVIGPVEDGGYDLIMLKRPYSALFEMVSWGTEHVFEETMTACSVNQLRPYVLNKSFDLDRPEDLKRAPPSSWQINTS